jgi:hypothetical protein
VKFRQNLLLKIQPENMSKSLLTLHSLPRRLFALTTSLVLFTNSAGACVGCRVTTDDVARVEPSTVSAGFAFSWSVLFMLIVVGFLITFLVSYIARAVARLDANNQPPL